MNNYNRPIITWGNSFYINISMQEFVDGEYENFDLTTATDLEVYLVCATHNQKIPLDYEILDEAKYILKCFVDYRLLHTTSYGICVEGNNAEGTHFRWYMLPKEGLLVVSNTSGMEVTDEVQTIDLAGRVGWGIQQVVQFESLTPEQIDMLKGATGAPGKDGSVYFEDLTPEQKEEIRGPQGLPGATGATGPAGATGAPGRDGVDGTVSFEDLTPEQVESLRGPQGVVGPRGERGETGPQGERGERGYTGATGIQGPRGERGEKGEKGDTGIQGPIGETGPQGKRGPAGDDGLIHAYETAVNDYGFTGDIEDYERYLATIPSIADGVEADVTVLNDQINNEATGLRYTKQDKLVSGTNIKTINNKSILGSGNINIQGGSGGGTELWNSYSIINTDYSVNVDLPDPDSDGNIINTNSTVTAENDLTGNVITARDSNISGAYISNNGIFGYNHTLAAGNLNGNLLVGIANTYHLNSEGSILGGKNNTLGDPNNNNLSLNSSLVLGQNHTLTTSINNSAILGWSNNINRLENSVVLGSSNTINHSATNNTDCAIVMGWRNNITGLHSGFVSGEQNNIYAAPLPQGSYGQGSSIFGLNNTLYTNEGYKPVLIVGRDNYLGDSTLWGTSPQWVGDKAIIGRSLRLTTDTSFHSFNTVIGQYNKYIDETGEWPQRYNDALFLIGGGKSESTRKNVMVIDDRGELYIDDTVGANASLWAKSDSNLFCVQKRFNDLDGELEVVANALLDNDAKIDNVQYNIIPETRQELQQRIDETNRAIQNTQNTVNGLSDALDDQLYTAAQALNDLKESIPEGGVTSFNGATGAVTYTAPVTSVNGMTGAVTYEAPVTSVNGMTGAVNIQVPVTSVNGMTGAVTIQTGGDPGFIKVTNGSKVGLVNSLATNYNSNIGDKAVIEGDGVSTVSARASGTGSHAEGGGTEARGDYAHAEGRFTHANGHMSHAEGDNTSAIGVYSHVEGSQTLARDYSHAEGFATTATGQYSHTEGANTYAAGSYSHAEGNGTRVNNDYEHASGRYNTSIKTNTTFGDAGNTLFSVGNGTADNERNNAFEIRQNGDIYLNDGSHPISSTTNGLKIEVVAALPASPDANTIYIVQ